MAKHISKPASKRPSPALARVLLLQVEEAGGDADAILARAGVARRAGSRHLFPWSGPLSQTAFSAIYHDCIAFLEVQASRSAHRPPMTRAEFEMLCHCVITCRTLADAIDRAAAFCDMLNGRGGQLSVRTLGAQAEFRMRSLRATQCAGAYLADLTGLSTYHRLFGWLIGEDIQPLVAHVCYPPLIDAAVAARLLSCPVVHSAPDNLLRFPARYLQRPVVRTPFELAELLRSFPFELTTMQSKTAPLSERVGAIFGAAIAQRQPLPATADLVAMFSISATTLKRRLGEEGTSLQKLKDRCRYEVARNLLDEGRLSLGEIAVRVGMSDVTTFRRAFRNWAGRSPSAYRRAVAGPMAG
ncbi:AraC family transcriptional regulator [Sphingobium estronivorans]|uniref:AraC family transcriptional regulator n=1 Tax=Sphingobium estronivorans TaxID=1577690 RepID=UPI00123A6DB9|nr:AraC family transcriptional regulator [Sphingobium estronivorans]